MKALKHIEEGVLPTTVFRLMLASRPQLANADLAEAFVSYFHRADRTVSKVAIWNWRRPDGSRIGGLSDRDLDELLLTLLGQAGYTVHLRENHR